VSEGPDVRTKRDRIVEQLHELILGGELPRGSRLQQDQLARRFQTSITPVREALRLLESEGLVVGEAHRGVRIASLDEDQLKANYIVRRLVEPYALQRACLRVTRKDLGEAGSLNEQLADAAARGDGAGAREANRSFHFLFYERCGVPTLPQHIRSLWLVFPWDMALTLGDRTTGSVRQHERILATVAEGDMEAAAAAMSAHLFSGYAAIMRYLAKGEPADPFPPDAD
jgi:DNA-binding GntR family transcriptional regulator